jgi:O-antigen/teichoic acid export membrane protein
MNLIKKSGITFGVKVASASLNLISGILIARILGPSGKGIYTMVILIPTMAIMLGNMGIDSANIHFVGKKKYALKDIISNSLFSSLLFSLVLISIMVIFRKTINQLFLKNCNILYLNIVILSIPLLFINRFLGAIILGQNRIIEFNFLQIIQPTVIVLGLIIFLLFFDFGILSTILIWSMGVIVTLLFSFLFIVRYAPIRLKFSPMVFKDNIKFGIKGHIANLSTFINYRIDMFMISFFKGTKSLGYYSIGVGLAELVWYISDSVSKILAPKIATSKFSEANRITPVVSRNVFAWSTLMMIVLLILSKYIVKFIYGEQFLPSVVPLRFLSLGIISLSFDKVLSADLLGRGKIEIAMYASICAMITNVFLNLFLIPKYGISGAAIASSVSYTVSAILILIPYSRISKVNVSKIIMIQKNDFKLYKIK